MAMRRMKKAASGMKKRMKAMKASGMKSMRRMRRAMKVSKIARGKRARSQVFSGRKLKNSSGLTKNDLKKNKRGKIVSKKQSARGLKQFKRIQGWFAATQKARKALGIKGFCPIGGKTKQGQEFLKKTRSFYKK